MEFYGNIAQAYRPLTYENLTPVATVSRIDPHMKDSYRYNADLGLRGTIQHWLHFDLCGFLMQYNQRVGILSDSLGNTTRTNVANSFAQGMEFDWEININKVLSLHLPWELFLYHSLAFNLDFYTSGSFKGNHVQYAPSVISREGFNFYWKGLSADLHYSNVSRSFGDGNNSVMGNGFLVCIIPAYRLLDFSSALKMGPHYQIKVGVDNLVDERYFTRRTDEYPGHGIIPAAGRFIYGGLKCSF